jgi:hypothetical protein
LPPFFVRLWPFLHPERLLAANLYRVEGDFGGVRSARYVANRDRWVQRNRTAAESLRDSR